MNSFTDSNMKWRSRELQIEVNNTGVITQITSNCYGILCYETNEILNTNISKYLNYTFGELIENQNFNVEISKKDGLKRFFDVQVTPVIINDNKIESIYLSLIDISKYKEFQDREKIFFKIFEDSKDIVSRLELIPEPKFTYISPSVEDIVGYTVEEHMKNPMIPFEIVHPDDRDIQFSKMKIGIDSSKFHQVRMKHKNGYYVWIEDYIIPQYNEDNQLVAIESITRNIQKRKELEQRLEKLGYHDNLTGIFNKNYFLKEMDLLSNRINIPIGIIVCDLDNLKYINDSLGHSKGDNLIKNTGKVLQSVFNNGHVVSRTGGDEFVIIIKNKSFLEVKGLYDELQNSIDQFNEKNNDIPIEISIGLAYSETSLNAMESTLDIADSNMYRNKKQKKQI